MFDPKSVEVFRFTSCSFDEKTGTAAFGYALDDEVHFSETFVFPTSAQPFSARVRTAVDRALFLLSLVAGTSYYKTCVAPVAKIETGSVTQNELDYLQDLYFEGLGEFSYVNQLSLRGRPEWKAQITALPSPPALGLDRRSLVAVGGGKDSCVSIETLRGGNEPIVLASVNSAKPIVGCIKAADLPSVTVSRSLSPRLFELNAEGALNGHVPVTAAVSLALVVAALITNADAVVMSNERSASSGNLQWDGREINHQWSKSLDAERSLASLVQRSIAPDLQYFSLLRPLSELDIARRFASTTRYDSVFTSCNRAFRIDATRRIDHWCGECDKCRFVYLALAPHTEPKRLRKIFGKDMLGDPSQIPGYEALCGWFADKPFECVGEIEESIAAFLMLGSQDTWSQHLVVRYFIEEVIPKMVLPPDILTAPFNPSSKHHVPTPFLSLLESHHATL